MTKNVDKSRRKFLKYGGAVTVAGLAGCMGDNGNGNGDYPSQAIDVIVPWSQGGGTDRSMRATTPAWQEAMDADFAVRNQPGAGTQVGGEELYGSEPDGYTIAMWNLPHMQATWLFQDAEYDHTDFDYIGTHHLDPTTWFAPEDSPYDDMAEFIDYAEDNEVNVGTTAAIGNTALSALLVQDTYDVDFNIVNLEGGSPVREAILAGDVDAAVNQPWSFNPDHEGEVTALGTHNNEPTDLWDVPTFGELGLGDELPLVEEGFGQWKLMVAPGGLQEEYPDRFEMLVDSYEEAMESDEFQEAAEEQGNLDLIVNYQGPEETQEEVEAYSEFMEQYQPLFEEF